MLKPTGSPQALSDPADEARASALLTALSGPRAGLLREVSRPAIIDGDAPLFHVGARIANPHPLWEGHEGLLVGGAGTSPAQALLAAIGEAVERYHAACPDPRSLRRCSYEELLRAGQRAIEPARFAPYSPAQRAQAGFPFATPTAHTPLAWMPSEDLLSGQPCWVPAFAVFAMYDPGDTEPVFTPGVSTGLACHSDPNEATRRALCECVERDAANLHWLTRTPALPVPTQRLLRLAGHALPPRDRCAAWDLTPDADPHTDPHAAPSAAPSVALPVSMVLTRGSGPLGEIVAVGTACHPDPDLALLKASIEASQTRVFNRLQLERDPHWQPAPDGQNINDFGRHARAYCGRPRWLDEATAFLTSSRAVPAAPAAPIEHPTPLERLRPLCSEVCRIDLTQPWARSLGLTVVRVLTPSLLPLHGDHRFPPLAHPRLQAWCAAASARWGIPMGPDLRFPHPFP